MTEEMVLERAVRKVINRAICNECRDITTTIEAARDIVATDILKPSLRFKRRQFLHKQFDYLNTNKAKALASRLIGAERT